MAYFQLFFIESMGGIICIDCLQQWKLRIISFQFITMEHILS